MGKYQDKDVTKIVYFSVFDNSDVLDHLEHQDRYLLKLCRDPNIFEEMVDALHPDVILIDCTGNFSGMADPSDLIRPEELEPHKRIEPDKIIELDNIVGSSDGCTVASESAAGDEEGYNELTRDHNSTHAGGADMDALVSYLPDHLPIWDIAERCQIIFLFDPDPGMELRLQCLENGCDVMIPPFPLAELDFRIRLHAEKSELNYRASWQRATLDRAVEHIDKLKQIILGTRDEFSREKELLYNSLKQINMMSSERELLKKKLHRAKVELHENIRGINNFLCTMVESRNEYQKGHSSRVAQISEFVANKIGMKAQAVRILKSAAMLHEVGMLLIPTSILNKEPSELSDYEKNMMLMHPANGAAYLKMCPGFEKVAGIIRYLNENSDGTGSPDGLKKRYIPLPSKVLAGADLLDQIWIDNPHASVERLLEILEGYAGSRLDPSIVSFLEKYLVTVLAHQVDHDHARLKEIAVFQLRPGMVIGSGIFTKTGTKLFSPGTTMSEETIALLERYTREYPVGETVFIKVDW